MLPPAFRFPLAPSGPKAEAAPEAAFWTPKVSENIGSLDDSTLRWMAQLGLEWVVLQGTDWVDRGAKGYWTVDDIRPQERCQREWPGSIR
ncbi:MAG: hypothetical protein R2748_06970 [Bryobacterales bacterium]